MIITNKKLTSSANCGLSPFRKTGAATTGLHAVPEVYVYAGLALAVILLSLPALGINLLILDDLALYSEALEGRFNVVRLRRMLLVPFINQGLAEIMVYSPVLARGAVLVLGMAPLSILSYIVYREILSLPRGVAFFAALLPQILPGQPYIPAFVIGSYTVWGLCFYLVSLICSFRYLESRRLWLLFTALLFYAASLETMEISVFLFIPLLFLVAFSRPIDKRAVLLLTLLGLAAASKAAWTIYNPYSNVTAAQPFELAIALSRLRDGISWSFPDPAFGHIPHLPLLGLLFAALCLFLDLVFPQGQSARHATSEAEPAVFQHRKRTLVAYTFGIVWFLASMSPFLVSTYFSNRYVYVAGFGFNLLMVLSCFSFFPRLGFHRLRPALAVILIGSLLVGVYRFESLRHTFGPREKAHAALHRMLSPRDFPADSQVVVVGGPTGYLFTGGYWVWSTGYLRYTLKRVDVSGLVGPEMVSYNPFQLNKRGYGFPMHGLRLTQPVFLFRFDGSDLLPVRYCLVWGEGRDAEAWTIYRLDDLRGDMAPLRTGRGKTDYALALEELSKAGVSPTEIMWAPK
jgi:hypothetical protein